MADLGAILDDLSAEHDSLDDLVVDLDDTDWDRMTPAEPWTIRDQISHLAYFDEQALLSVTDPDGFMRALGGISDIKEFVDAPVERGRGMDPLGVLKWWREARWSLSEALRSVPEGTRLAWYGPPMSAASFATARLMETWAHGQDVADAMGIARTPTGRLRHIAFLGVRARPFSYQVNGRILPAGSIAVSLWGPNDDVWEWVAGEGPGAGSVTGPALDFCLVTTQRRHPDDTALVVEGEGAREWIDIAQAFAGPPGEGRRPGQFVRPSH